MAVYKARCAGKPLHQEGDAVHLCLAADLLSGYLDYIGTYFIGNPQSEKKPLINQVQLVCIAGYGSKWKRRGLGRVQGIQRQRWYRISLII